MYFPGSYSQIVDVLSRGLCIRYNAPVTNINYRSSMVSPHAFPTTPCCSSDTPISAFSPADRPALAFGCAGGCPDAVCGHQTGAQSDCHGPAGIPASQRAEPVHSAPAKVAQRSDEHPGNGHTGQGARLLAVSLCPALKRCAITCAEKGIVAEIADASCRLCLLRRPSWCGMRPGGRTS